MLLSGNSILDIPPIKKVNKSRRKRKSSLKNRRQKGGNISTLGVPTSFPVKMTGVYLFITLKDIATLIATDPNFQQAFKKEMDPNGMLGAMSGDAGFASSILDASAKTKEEKVFAFWGVPSLLGVRKGWFR
jgi:hypothetical protein